jgi:septal ring factor EnvC (AmiA/AmiB activator)
VVGQLKTREKEITREIKAKQAEADKLEKEIQRIIAAEMRKARELAERESLEKEAKELGLVPGKDFTSKTDNKRLRVLINEKRKSMNMAEKPAEPATPTYSLTPEARQLAANFAANRGTLPWPVERGIIVGKFGKQPHPVAKGIVVNNPHIEIATDAGAKARASFDGEVTSIIRIPGANKAVLVRHGNYYTVYGNLVEVYVKAGDKVRLKQELGSIYTDRDNQTILEFGLWLEDQIQNPEPWLVK